MALESALTEVEGNINSPSFKGTAVHDLTGYRALVAEGGEAATAPRQRGSLERGLFIWDYTVALDDAKQDELLAFLSNRGINAVYFESQLLVREETHHAAFTKLLSRLTEAGVEIDLLHACQIWIRA